jgi:hypothetical protein
MKRMRSKRELEIEKIIDQLTLRLLDAQKLLSLLKEELLGYKLDYEESGDETLLTFIEETELDIANTVVDALALELEIEELEEEAKTA